MAIALVFSYIRWTPDKPWPPEPEPFIQLAEATVEPVVMPIPRNAPADLDAAALAPEYTDVPSQAAEQSGTALQTSPGPGTPAKESSTKNESAVKVVKKDPPKQTGSREDAEKKEREAAAQRTRNDVANAFAKPNSQNNANNRQADQGTSGKPTGKPDSAGPANSTSTSTGVRTGRIGGGWQWPAYNVRIKTPLTGTVTVNIVINKDGSVRSAKAVGGTPPAAGNAAVRSQCEDIARSKSFTRSANAGEAPDHANATLTFVFE